MSKIITAVVGGLIAFGVGIIGVYMAMPTLAPGVVEKAQAHIDSLALVDSLAQIHLQQATQDGTQAPSLVTGMTGTASDSMAMYAVPGDDSLDQSGGLSEAMGERGSMDAVTYEAVVASMEDSLAALKDQIQALEKEKATLRTFVETLRQQQADMAAQRADVQELSKTLTKLEDKELTRVVEQLDELTLEALYREASSRDRTRLLQAMPASYAAAFVRRIVSPRTASPPSDTLAAAEGGVSDPASAN